MVGNFTSLRSWIARTCRPAQAAPVRSDQPATSFAAVTFGLAKNHPFIDGNKRTALLALYTFLFINGVDYIVPEAEAAAMTLALAASEVGEEGLARWIRDNGLADDALVMTPDTMAAPVAVYLGKPAYYLDCSCVDNFMFYHNPFHESQIPARLAQAVRELKGKPILFVTSDALTPGQASEIGGYGIGMAMSTSGVATSRNGWSAAWPAAGSPL